MWHSFLVKLLHVNQAFAQIGNPGNGGGGIELPNPLGEGTTIFEIMQNITRGLLQLATPIFILMMLIGAFFFMFSGGNDERIKTGKQVLLYAVIGYGIILWAEGIMLIIRELLSGNASI